MGEYLGGGVRLPSPDSQRDGHVANVPLQELCDGPHFLDGCGRGRGESRYLLLHLRRGFLARARQLEVPVAHLPPIAEALTRHGAARGIEGHDHLSPYSAPRRHALFVPELLDIAHHPLPLVAGLHGFHFRGIQPGRLVFPSRWKLQRVMRFPYWGGPLKGPNILQNQRLLVPLVFIPDDVSRIRGRYEHDLVFHISDQLDARDHWRRALDGVLVPDLVVFSLGGNAPGAYARDLLAGVKGNT